MVNFNNCVSHFRAHSFSSQIYKDKFHVKLRLCHILEISVNTFLAYKKVYVSVFLSSLVGDE
jgi:hypothetical protein